MLASITIADLAVEANLALTIFLAVAVVLLWREVFPSHVSLKRHRRRSDQGAPARPDAGPPE